MAQDSDTTEEHLPPPPFTQLPPRVMPEQMVEIQPVSRPDLDTPWFGDQTDWVVRQGGSGGGSGC